jgi:hypothetical protein
MRRRLHGSQPLQSSSNQVLYIFVHNALSETTVVSIVFAAYTVHTARTLESAHSKCALFKVILVSRVFVACKALTKENTL